MGFVPLPRSWGLVLLDLLVALWVVAWIFLGGVTSASVDRLSAVGGALNEVAASEDDLGASIAPLARLPLVNLNLGPLEDQLHAAAAASRSSAADEARSTHTLARVAGLGVVMLSLFPVVFLYVPARLARLEETRSLRRDLHRYGSEPAFSRYLAARALVHLPYQELRRFSDDPPGDFAAGRTDGLAEAELRRLGIRGRPGSRRRELG